MQTDKFPELTVPMAHFPHIKDEGNGHFVISGQGHRNPINNTYRGMTGTKDYPVYDVKEAVIAVFSNLKLALESEGLNLSHLTIVNVFLIRKEDFKLMNEVWNSIFPEGESAPTRTTCGVAWLPGENIIEMSARASRNVTPSNKVNEAIFKV